MTTNQFKYLLKTVFSLWWKFFVFIQFCSLCLYNRICVRCSVYVTFKNIYFYKLKRFFTLHLEFVGWNSNATYCILPNGGNKACVVFLSFIVFFLFSLTIHRSQGTFPLYVWFFVFFFVLFVLYFANYMFKANHQIMSTGNKNTIHTKPFFRECAYFVFISRKILRQKIGSGDHSSLVFSFLLSENYNRQYHYATVIRLLFAKLSYSKKLLKKITISSISSAGFSFHLK